MTRTQKETRAIMRVSLRTRIDCARPTAPHDGSSS